MRSYILFLTAGLLAGLQAPPLMAQQVTKESVAGIRNLARLETTVACAGAITADAVPEIKKMGFVSIVNLRLATEPGAEVEKEAAAAKAAGLRYIHVPFDGSFVEHHEHGVTAQRPRWDHDLASNHRAGRGFHIVIKRDAGVHLGTQVVVRL